MSRYLVVGSEDGAEEAEEALEGAAQEGAAAPGCGTDAGGAGGVGVEYAGHLVVKLRGVDQEVALEVMLEAAEVKVGGAYGAEVIIDHEHLGMEHPRVIEVDFDAGGKALGYVAL